jgi:hypothetical protein
MNGAINIAARFVFFSNQRDPSVSNPSVSNGRSEMLAMLCGSTLICIHMGNRGVIASLFYINIFISHLTASVLIAHVA